MDLRSRARQIVTAVSHRTMPPWKPEPGYGAFAGSRRLSDAQVKTFEAWLEQGMEVGDPDDLPVAPIFSGDWQLGPPDLIVRLSKPYSLPASGPDRMRNFVMPIPITARRYVRAWEFRTDEPQVVHHATMMLDGTRASRRLDDDDPEPGYEGLIPLAAEHPDGYFLGWTPGQSASRVSQRMAWSIRPDTDLVLMLHLRPAGIAAAVNASVALYFSDTPPVETPAIIRLNRQDIDIPPGERQYTITDSYRLPVDVAVFGVQPHAHYLARQVKGFATLPDGRSVPLIYIRDWNFHWQDAYQYAEPIELPAGSTVNMEFVYDNSEANPANPNRPPLRVAYGQRSSDEMGDLWVQVLPRRAIDLAVLNADLQKKLLPQNIAGYRMMLAADPDSVSLHDDLALLYISAGDVRNAEIQFAASLALAPERAAAHYNVGNIVFASGRQPASEAYFRDALAVDPNHGLAHQGLALALDAQGRLDEAVAHLEQAVQILASADSRFNLGVLRQKQGRPDAARAEYEAALRVDPTSARPMVALGRLELSQRHPADAMVWFERALPALRDLRDRAGVQLELAWMLATSPTRSLRQPAQALALADSARAAISTPDARALDVRAAALAAGGRFDEAIASAREGLRLMSVGQSEGIAAIQHRLELYQRHQPYVDGHTAPQP